MLTVVILLTLLTGCCLAQDQNLNAGEAIYVPNSDILGSIPNGIPMFKPFSPDCFKTVNISVTTKQDDYYKETSSFYRSTTVQVGMSVSMQTDFTLGVTLDSTTSSISSSKRTVSGNSLILVAKSHKRVLKAECILNGELDDRLSKAFLNLDDTVASPWYPESWRDYDIFIRTFGSHMIAEVIYGSSINQYAFAQTSSQYSQRDFTVKSCISLAGPGGSIESTNVSLCSNITQEEISRVERMEMSESLTVRGGTDETRNRLTFDRSHAVITKFMDEGYSDPAPIQFTLRPIWEILESRYVDEFHLKKAINLEYYYKGYKNFGCPYQQTTTGAVKVDLQKFDLAPHATPDYPEYECTLAPLGCHSWSEDCHYHVGVWCYCSGPSCVHYSEYTQNTGVKRETAAPYHGNDWGWNGCDWQVWGSKCRCNNERKQRKVIWSGSSHSALYAGNDEIRKLHAQLHPRSKKNADQKIKSEL